MANALPVSGVANLIGLAGVVREEGGWAVVCGLGLEEAVAWRWDGS